MTGALALGITDTLAGILGLGMFIYFVSIEGNGLKSILCHLFGAWSLRYLILGMVSLGAFLGNKDIISENTLRFVTTFFVLLEFSALIRLYFYIQKK
jgi:hypothetical protein